MLSTRQPAGGCCEQDESRPDTQEQTSTEARPQQPEPSAQQAEADAAATAAAASASGVYSVPCVDWLRLVMASPWIFEDAE